MQNGELMAKLRDENGLSQRQMANILNVTLTVYKLYEAGVRPMKLEELNQFSNYFHLSLNTLLGFSECMNFCEATPIDYKYLRFSMKYVRKIHRVTQKDLAKELRVSVPTVSRYEKHPEDLNASYLHDFAKRFLVSADYICGKTLKKEVL